MKVDADVLYAEMAKKKFMMKDLAERSGISRATILNMKKGMPPKPDTLGRIAEALDISVERLLKKEAKEC